MPANIGEMFYYGKTPWHGLGTQLSNPATIEQAIRAGRLDWRVELVPLVTAENPHTPTSRRKAVVRSDRKPGDPTRVIGVVHRHYKPLQNEDGLRLFDALIGHGKAIYHTGGYLGNGEVIWMLARMPGDILIGGDDVVEPYMLFTNSHDATSPIDMRLTTVRVVCQNTLALALESKNSSHVFTRAHKFDPAKIEEEAKAFFQISRQETESLGQILRAMHKRRFTQAQFTGIINRLLPEPKRPVVNAPQATRTSYEKRMEQLETSRTAMTRLFTDGMVTDTIKNPPEETLWGALNAVTAYVDHGQEIKGDRYAHIMFGQGATLKRKAYEMAMSELHSN